jgi:hypothetical protein
MDTVSLAVVKEVYVVSGGVQGPPGATGPAGPSGAVAGIDDTVAALNSTFSSQHILELISPFAISSFSISQTLAEMGATVTSETLNWGSNYPPDSISINNGIGAVVPATLTSYVHSGQTITTNRTYTLSMVKGGSTKTANATLSFLNQYYYGVAASQLSSEVAIKALTHALYGARGRTLTFDCSGGRYFHIAYPSRLGDATFTINGLAYSDMTKTVVSITNASGFAENYNVYYCNAIQNGAAVTLVIQ